MNVKRSFRQLYDSAWTDPQIGISPGPNTHINYKPCKSKSIWVKVSESRGKLKCSKVWKIENTSAGWATTHLDHLSYYSTHVCLCVSSLSCDVMMHEVGRYGTSDTCGVMPRLHLIHVARNPDTSCIHALVSTGIRIEVASPGYLYPATCIWCKRGFRILRSEATTENRGNGGKTARLR